MFTQKQLSSRVGYAIPVYIFRILSLVISKLITDFVQSQLSVTKNLSFYFYY